MFKWVCLGVGVAFLAVVVWMLNDIRQETRKSVETFQVTGQTVNEHLPVIVEKSRTTTETLADLAEDIRQLKELAGVSNVTRDRNMVAYADSVLDAIEASGGTIGLRKLLGGSGLKDTLPAREWVVAARKEAVVLTALAKTRKELATRLGKNKFGSPWYIQVGSGEPEPLLDWLRANHPPSKELGLDSITDAK
jgi:hypothetical protein